MGYCWVNQTTTCKQFLKDSWFILWGWAGITKVAHSHRCFVYCHAHTCLEVLMQLVPRSVRWRRDQGRSCSASENLVPEVPGSLFWHSLLAVSQEVSLTQRGRGASSISWEELPEVYHGPLKATTRLLIFSPSSLIFNNDHTEQQNVVKDVVRGQ